MIDSIELADPILPPLRVRMTSYLDFHFSLIPVGEGERPDFSVRDRRNSASSAAKIRVARVLEAVDRGP